MRTGILGWTIAFKEDVPLPGPHNPNVTIAPNDILIKLKSAAINPVDYKLPKPLEEKSWVSGIVERIGSSR